MDRNKIPPSARGAKGKITQYPQDLFALGSKSTNVLNRDAEAKRSIHGKAGTSGSSERKRDTAASGIPTPTKKPKLTGSSSPGETSPCSTILEVDPVDLVPSVLAALDTHNSDKLLGLLTGAIRSLKSQRWKPDLILCHSLIYLAKIKAHMFSNDTVTQSLCGLLKREQGTAFKSKGNPLVFVLACNLLYIGHKESKSWPDIFIKVYIEDALNERWWVNCTWCKCFVENVVTAFGTQTPPSHLIPTEGNTLGTMSPSGSPLLGTTEEDTETFDLDYTVFPRFSGSYETVEAMVLEAIKDQLGRRAAPDAIGKGFLKLLAATCGFPEIRMLAACRLEAWLQSAKLWRAAQELLAYVCCNIGGTAAAQRDHEVLAHLARMRLKTKPLVNAYIACIREMVSENPVILRSMITHTFYNELSNVRNPNNMSVIAALVQAQPQAVPQAMAETYQELLMRPEEYLRSLRALTREVTRAGRADATAALAPLCRALATPPLHEPPVEIRERAFSAIADLFCLCCMLTASHYKQLPDYKMQISTIQCDSTWWMLETAMVVYQPSAAEYTHVLHKLMFLEPVDVYCKVDNWPPESERALNYRMSCEVPLLQNTLIRIIFIGLSKELPITPGEALELIEQLVRRACSLNPEENPLPIEKLDVADYIFQLCQYHHPENISLPAGYTAPSLAIISLYWRAWIMLVMLAAHNPTTFAKEAFHKFPTLKGLIEMCITNKWTCDWIGLGQPVEPENEKNAVLQFEAHLAAASNAKLPITEHNSRLLSQLMLMEPLGPARRPPAPVLECLQQLCGQRRLGPLLCRQPALLLDIVERHGTRRAMPWLHDLLHNSHHSLSVLPVQCLCEFLVADAAAEGDKSGGGGGGGKAVELLRHLQALIADAAGARAVLAYFLQRLAHAHDSVRRQANRGLKLVLKPIDSEEISEAEWSADVDPEEWLSLMPSIPHWAILREDVAIACRAACLIDAEARRIAAYVTFLAAHADTCETPDTMHELLLDMSQLIVERMAIMSALIPQADLEKGRAQLENEGVLTEDHFGPHHTLHAFTTIFHNYMLKIREPSLSESAYDWSASQDRILLQWSDGKQCTLHILVAHASVILLSYGPSAYDAEGALYQRWRELWLGPSPPSAYLVDTSEEALLLPDWLRLRMLRSRRPALVDAVLQGLDAHQLALFIQSFGIPVSSVTALLKALDACPAEDIQRLQLERGYISQLVAVQRARGAEGGHLFCEALQLLSPEYPEETLFEETACVQEADTEHDLFGEDAIEDTEYNVIPVGHIGPLLATAFIGDRSYLGDIDAAFSSLQMILTKETNSMDSPCFSVTDFPYSHAIVTYLAITVRTPQSYQLATNIFRKRQYSAPIFRLLGKCMTTPFGEYLVNIASTLLKLLKECDDELTETLRKLSLGKSDSEIAAKGSLESMESDLNAADKSVDMIVNELEACTSSTIEKVGRRLIETCNTRTFLSALTAILAKSQKGDYDRLSVKVKNEGGPASDHVFSEKNLGCGLIIDWLAELQPEILDNEPEVQMRLMFSPGGTSWRPLLVTLLVHQASWKTLHTCLMALLKPNSGWEASSVLDLVSALTRSPRVWQGRDKNTPIYQTNDDFLNLNRSQLAVLVEYILEEASTKQSTSTNQMEARLPLLLECCEREEGLVIAALRGAEDRLLKGDSVAATFVALLYMRLPKILNMLTDADNKYINLLQPRLLLLPPPGEDNDIDSSTSIVDKISHCLFTALAATPHSKDFTKRSVGVDAACRTLCRRHWRLAVRQLPLLGALLGGRARLNWQALKGRDSSPGGLALFSHVLAGLEVVPQPVLFAPKHRKHFHTILDCYMALAQKHGTWREVSQLMYRVAALMRNYATHDLAAVDAYLSKHREIVSKQPPLAQLMGMEEGSAGSVAVSMVAINMAAPSSSQPPPHACLALSKCCTADGLLNSEDVHWALQEVEAWGSRRGGAWGGSKSAASLLSSVAPLISHPHSTVRTSALSLLTKLLPAVHDTKPALSAIMQCLDASNAEVTVSTLEKLPDLIVSLQESAVQIMMKAFELGMKSQINTEMYITKCVNSLNAHRGC